MVCSIPSKMWELGKKYANFFQVANHSDPSPLITRNSHRQVGTFCGNLSQNYTISFWFLLI